MSKSQGWILAFLIAALTFFSGYLGYRYTLLQERIATLQALPVPEKVDTASLEKSVTDLQKRVDDQATKLKNLAADMASLPQDLKNELKKEFVPHPESTAEKNLFIAKAVSDSQIDITGDLFEIARWEERNELFLDYIYQDSLLLDYNNSDKIFVSEIMTDSLFHQMGLKKSDILLKVDGQTITNPDDFRIRILEQIPTKIEITRDGKPLTLAINYQPSLANKIVLTITQDEFKKVLPDALKSVHVAPAMKNGKVFGVKIVSVDPISAFHLMGFQTEDVLTQINDTPLTVERFLSDFEKAESPLSIDFERSGKMESIHVSFAN